MTADDIRDEQCRTSESTCLLTRVFLAGTSAYCARPRGQEDQRTLPHQVRREMKAEQLPGWFKAPQPDAGGGRGEPGPSASHSSALSADQAAPRGTPSHWQEETRCPGVHSTAFAEHQSQVYDTEVRVRSQVAPPWGGGE